MDVTPQHTDSPAREAEGPDGLEAAVRRTALAATAYRGWSRGRRAELLDALADAIDGARDTLVPLAHAETHLGAARLQGELTRTSYQQRVFAREIRDGGYLEATIDHAAQTPMGPTPDLRRMLVPLGAVAVYSASNFPFAFSVLGGDTASALAAGNAVVVKVHPGHPRTSRAVSRIAEQVFSAQDAPADLLTFVEGFEDGVALVRHPLIRAAGFTGSLGGGRALADAAAARPDPIPFYGELASLNPVLVTPRAAATRAEEFGTGLAGSILQGGGQFCTKPGLIMVPTGDAGDRLVASIGSVIASAAAKPALTSAMAASYSAGAADRAALAEVRARGRDSTADDQTRPLLLETSATALSPALLEECFGPLAVVVRYGSAEEAMTVVDMLDGSLTATMLTAEDRDDQLGDVLAALTEKVGRVLFNGYPTGVAVNHAQHHGGPWPATNTVHTSVGVTAIRRFLRPIAWQDAPQEVLPIELREESTDVPRRVDGSYVLAAQHVHVLGADGEDEREAGST